MWWELPPKDGNASTKDGAIFTNTVLVFTITDRWARVTAVTGEIRIGIPGPVSPGAWGDATSVTPPGITNVVVLLRAFGVVRGPDIPDARMAALFVYSPGGNGHHDGAGGGYGNGRGNLYCLGCPNGRVTTRRVLRYATCARTKGGRRCDAHRCRIQIR